MPFLKNGGEFLNLTNGLFPKDKYESIHHISYLNWFIDNRSFNRFAFDDVSP